MVLEVFLKPQVLLVPMVLMVLLKPEVLLVPMVSNGSKGSDGPAKARGPTGSNGLYWVQWSPLVQMVLMVLLNPEEIMRSFWFQLFSWFSWSF
ncbi:hypothetical protein NQZ68_030591 [Dissostichus eleginoides]|nr:hypothetical protein NQZ68_030591 [Dissostichus eleginoides]